MPEMGLSKAQCDKNGVLWIRFCIFIGRVIGVLAAVVGCFTYYYILTCTCEHLLCMLSAFGNWGTKIIIINSILKKLRVWGKSQERNQSLPIKVEVLKWGLHDTLESFLNISVAVSVNHI